MRELSPEAFDALAREVPATKLSRERLKEGIALADILTDASLVKSKRAARDLIGQGGAYVNNRAVKETGGNLDPDQVLSGRAILLRAGKKNYHLLIVE